MQFVQKVKDYFGEKLGERTRTLLIVLLGAAAMLLILLSQCESTEDTVQVQQDDDLLAYTQNLEQRLAQMVSSIEGAGSTKVMVTLANGVEYVYESEEKSSVDTSQSNDLSGRSSSDERSSMEQSAIIIDGSDGRQALVRTTLEPTVNGVVVLCSGAYDEQVRQQITEAVTTALGISSKRVCVAKLTN